MAGSRLCANTALDIPGVELNFKRIRKRKLLLCDVAMRNNGGDSSTNVLGLFPN